MLKFLIVILSSILFSQHVEFIEEFNDNLKNWKVINDSTRNIKIEDGIYKYSNNTNLIYFNFHETEFKEFYPWELELELVHKSGVINMPYGISWGAKDSKNQFNFTITGDKHFRVEEQIDGKRNELKKCTKLIILIQAMNQIN